VRVDQPQLQPFGDVLQMRRGAARERRRIDGWAREDRPSRNEPPQIRGHGLRGLISEARIALHRFERDRLERFGNAWSQLDGQRRTRRPDRVDDLLIGPAVVRRTAGQQLVEHHAERVDIGTGVDGLRPVELFGREVAKGPFQVTRARIPGAQAEVENPGSQRRVHHDVRRLQVAVLDAERVRMMDGLADFRQHSGALRELQGGPDPPELETLDVLHHDHGRIAGPELEDPHDPPVGEERECARLTQELGDSRHPPVAPDDLPGDDAIELEVAQLVDLAHAAAAEALDRLEAGDLRHAGLFLRDKPAVSRFRRERDRQRQVLGDQRTQRLEELRPPLAQRFGGQRFAVDHVMLHEGRQPFLERGGDDRHERGFETASVSAVMARE
jgi:hypothetical protein